MQVCCAELSLPVLPSDREKEIHRNHGFLCASLVTFCAIRKSPVGDTSFLPPAGGKAFFVKGNAPSGGPTFCARQKVGKERAKGGPPSWGPPLESPPL